MTEHRSQKRNVDTTLYNNIQVMYTVNDQN